LILAQSSVSADFIFYILVHRRARRHGHTRTPWIRHYPNVSSLAHYSNNSDECTIDQELASCLSARRLHFSARNDVMAAILNVWRHIKKPIPSLRWAFTWRTYLLNFITIPFERRSLRHFWRGRPIKKEDKDEYRRGISSWSKNS